MRNLWFVAAIIATTCLFAQTVAAQEAISDKNILSSFAKIIRTNQYICLPCSQVEPLGPNHSGLSYEVTCNNNLLYTVTLTHHSDMIVKPIITYPPKS